MDGVVSAHDGSVVVCGGHGVQWMVWSVHMHGSLVVCGGHGVQWMAWSVHMMSVWWCVVDMESNGWRGQCT